MTRGSMFGVTAACLALTACAVAPPVQGAPAAPRFEARGQEPGWLAQLDPVRGLVLTLDYGERRLSLPVPRLEPEGPGRVTYVVDTADASVRMKVIDRPCADVMSGRPYPAAVELRVDGRLYEGCGGPLP